MKKSRFHQNLESLGFETYEQYLASDHWKNKKAEYANAKRPHYCENANCHTPEYILHHLTYERIGQEDLDDFLALCNSCHRKLHDFMKGTGRWIYKAKTALKTLKRITEPREVILHDLPVQPIRLQKQYSQRVTEILAEMHTFSRDEWRAIAQASGELLWKANQDKKLQRRLKKEAKPQRVAESDVIFSPRPRVARQAKPHDMRPVDEVGQPCRHCGTPLIKASHSKKWEPNPEQAYYFKWWLRCPRRGCGTNYMVEAAKVILRQAPESVDEQFRARMEREA